MIKIDARTLACPAPVVKARQAIASLPKSGGLVQILVDNQLAAENLARMSEAAGYKAIREDQGDKIYAITITVGEDAYNMAPVPQSVGGLVVALGGDAMGRGAEELGEILVKGFLYSLSQLEQVPQALLLFNSGAKLAAQGANTVPDIQTLSERGTRIRVCGTCVDYYGITLGVGEIANMYDIVAEMTGAERVVTL
ncbi:MAG: sulfurtransferase-like selenium metabolism protein YedF [Oscillospiraceae bacterium]|nr:sulfurtransferase-like selenium metabolism protein YedF [Oscillospiraceae bacterium]